MEMNLLSIQVGMPKTLGRPDAEDPMDREWTSGFHKDPVSGPVAVSSTGLAGDGQADLKNHGGVYKAINAYPKDHYDFWTRELGLALPHGAFGENLTTFGATEVDVCIGDTFQLGEIVVQITQPRQPCWKLARKWRVADFALRVERTGKTGWYYRVVRTGCIAAPLPFKLLERPHPEWTVAEANAIMHHRKEDWDAALALSQCPALSKSWQTTLAFRAENRKAAPVEARRNGPPIP